MWRMRSWRLGQKLCALQVMRCTLDEGRKDGSRRPCSRTEWRSKKVERGEGRLMADDGSNNKMRR